MDYTLRLASFLILIVLGAVHFSPHQGASAQAGTPGNTITSCDDSININWNSVDYPNEERSVVITSQGPDTYEIYFAQALTRTVIDGIFKSGLGAQRGFLARGDGRIVDGRGTFNINYFGSDNAYVMYANGIFSEDQLFQNYSGDTSSGVTFQPYVNDDNHDYTFRACQVTFARYAQAQSNNHISTNCGAPNPTIQLCSFNPVPPAIPSNVQLSAVDATTLHISWQRNSTDESGFDITRDQHFPPAGHTPAGVTRYTWSGLSAVSYICIGVRTVNNFGTSPVTTQVAGPGGLGRRSDSGPARP